MPYPDAHGPYAERWLTEAHNPPKVWAFVQHAAVERTISLGVCTALSQGTCS